MRFRLDLHSVIPPAYPMKSPTTQMRRTIAFAFCLLALGSTCAFAQAPAKNEVPAATADPWFEISVVSIKPEKYAEYERLIKEEINPALKKGGLPWRNVFTRATFGELFEYVSVSPITRLGQYDEPDPLTKVLGQEATGALRAKLRGCYNRLHTYASRKMSDLAFTNNPGNAPIVVVSVIQLAPGRKAEWRKFMREEFVPVIRKSDMMGFEAHETMLGGNADEIVTVSWWKNYADLEKGPPIERVLGAEGAAKLMQKLPPGVVLRVDRKVQRLRAPLSYGQDKASP